MEADATTTEDIRELEEKQQVEDDDKSSQKKCLPSDKDAVSKETSDAAASHDDGQLMDKRAVASIEQEADITGFVDGDSKIPPEQPAAVEEDKKIASQDLSEQEEFDTDVRRTSEEDDAQSNRALTDDEQQTCAKVVPQISISVCSSVAVEDEDVDLPRVEDSSIPASVFEEDSLYTDKVEDDVESRKPAEEPTDAEKKLETAHQEVEQPFDVQTKETEKDDIGAEAESKEKPDIEDSEAATPEVERNLSQYPVPSEQETREVTVAVVHERKEMSETQTTTTEAPQLHDAKLLYSSTESMVSSTTSDWTVIDTREESETVESFSASTEKDAATGTQQQLDELSTSYLELEVVGGIDELEAKEEVLIEGLDETVEDEGTEAAAEDYLTASVTPTVDLMVMSTVLESIMEEEERTSSSQKTTSSSEKLEHDVSDSSKLLGSSPDVQHAVESPTFQPPGKFAAVSGARSSSDRDDVSVSSSLAEFERLERELQEKGSSESFSGGDKGSSESASAAAAAVLPESPQRKSSTSLSSSLAEFERIEHDILGQSGSLELITIDRKSHPTTESSSFSELQRIEELESASAAAAEEQFRSSSGSLAEFEYIEQQLRLNEELEAEALKVATMLQSSQKSPDADSSQNDVRLSKEQIPPESTESLLLAEAIAAQPAATAADVQYPHYQDIVHIIREASKSVHTFQLGDQETVSHTEATEAVSQVDDATTRLRQEETTTLESYYSKTVVKTTLLEDISAAVSTKDSVSRTEHEILQHSHEQELEETPDSRAEDRKTEDVGLHEEKVEKEQPETVGVELSSEIQEQQDLMKLSTDSLIVIQSGDDLMQLSTDSLQPTAMTSSTDSLELAAADSTEDVQRSSTSTLSSATTLLAAAETDDMTRSVFSGIMLIIFVNIRQFL